MWLAVNKGVKTFSDMWLANSLNVDPAKLSEVCSERVDVNRLANVSSRNTGSVQCGPGGTG